MGGWDVRLNLESAAESPREPKTRGLGIAKSLRLVTGLGFSRAAND